MSMVGSNKRNKRIFLLELQLSSVYILFNIVIWYLSLFFIVYRYNFSFLGIKLLLGIVNSIITHGYILKLNTNKKDIKLSISILKLFIITSIIGSILELVILHFIHDQTYYICLILIICSITTTVIMASICMFILTKYSNKLSLEENINTFYIPLVAKLSLPIYSIILFLCSIYLINYADANEIFYVDSIKNTAIDSILRTSQNIAEFNHEIIIDMRKYEKELANINLYRNLTRESVRDHFITNINNFFNNKYDYISVNINREELATQLPYSITLFKENSKSSNKYSIRTSDSLIPYQFDNEKAKTLINTKVKFNNQDDVYISTYYPLYLYNNKYIGYVVSDVNINQYNKFIRANSDLKDWGYLYYKIGERNVLIKSENLRITNNILSVTNMSKDLYSYVVRFENNIDNRTFFELPTFKVNGKKYIAIMVYLKNIDIVAIYYRDLTSILKNSTVEKSITVFVILFIVTFILICAFYSFIIKISFSSIKKANDSTEKLIGGKGDLRNRIYSKNNDEIGLLIFNFNSFINSLDYLIGNVKNENKNVFREIKIMEKVIDDNSNRINAQSSSITESVASINNIISSIQNVTNSTTQQKNAFNVASATVEDLLHTIYKINDNMEKQSSAVEQTSTSIEQMISNIASVAKSVNRADSFSKKLVTDAHNGGDSVDEVIEAVRGIEESSVQIKEIVNVIQNIAEQTNLLAMNAAIEASHAGEQGRGFSVVADEIRTLSENTAENTKSITNIIKTITKKIEEAVELAGNSGKSLDNILEATESTARVISEINIANNELEVGGKDILETIKHLNNITNAVKENVKEQINSGDLVDNQLTILDQINREVADIIESNSIGAKEVVHAMTFLNEISVKNIENNDTFINVTNKLNESFKTLNLLIEGFTTDADYSNEETNEYETNDDNDKDSGESELLNKYYVQDKVKALDLEIKSLEEELKQESTENVTQQDEDILKILKEDYKDPNMFYE